MPTAGEILAAVVSIIILGMLGFFMKKWIDGIESSMKKALAEAGKSMKDALDNVIKSIDRVKDEISTLFQRSEQERLERSKCQLEAAKTYATLKQHAELESRVRELERAD